MSKSVLASMDIMYVDHLAVTTPTFDRTLAEYLALPGSRLLKGPGLNAAQKVRYAFVMLREGLTVEILGLPSNLDSPIARHVKQGGGPYHFCYAVADLEDAIVKAAGAGAKLLVAPVPDVAFDGRQVAFLFDDALGVFELVHAFPSAVSDACPQQVGKKQDSRAKASQGTPATGKEEHTAALDKRLLGVFQRVFPALDQSSIADAVINITPEWDSLAHIRLMMELEGEFEVNISPEEIGRWVSYRQISEKLERQL